MDLALDVFLFVFVFVLIALTIFYTYHRSTEPKYEVGPISDGNYAVYWTPAIGGSNRGYLASLDGVVVNEISTDNESAPPGAVWHFDNILCCHGNNYYITQKDSSGNTVYLTNNAGLTLTQTRSHASNWKVTKIGDDNFTISSMTSDEPVCLSLIGDNFSVSNYGGRGNPALCNFNGTQRQLIADGTRVVQLYAVE